MTEERTSTGPLAAWMALGSFIGSHLMVIVPLGVALGIACPELLLPLKPWVPVLFAVMTFQNSLSNDLRALLDTLRRPRELLMTLLVVHVAMPLATFALGTLVFGAGSPTVAGIVLEYAVPVGSSTIMWTSMFGGDVALGLAALLVSTLLSPFSIPATLQLLVGATVEVDALGMVRDMALMVALPALAGTVTNELTHGRAEGVWAPRTAPVSRLLLPIIVSTNATSIATYMRHLTPELVGITLFMFACAVASFVVGMGLARVLAGSQERFVSMSFSCGIRNVSAGATLASRYFDAQVMFPAVIGTLFQQFLAAAFGRVMERVVSRK